MEDQTNPLFLLYSIAIAQFLLLGIIVFKKRDKQTSSFLLLLVLIISMMIIVGEFILTWSGYMVHFPLIIGISFSILFLLGPILFGLVSIEESKDLNLPYMLHFIPFAMAIAYQLYASSFITDKVEFYENEISTETYFSSLEYIMETFAKTVSILGYVLWIRWHKTKTNQKWNRINKGIWQVFLVIGLLLFCHALLLYLGLSGYALTYCTIIFLLGALGFWLNWTLIFPETKTVEDKYQNSGLSNSILKDQAIRIQNIMKNQQPYLNPNLKLGTLSEITGLSTHHLSQIINQAFEKNYSDFINGYRIEYAKTRLSEQDDKKTIQEIAFESGFNSKHSFNRSFKKILGVTPSDFRSAVRG